MRRHRDRRTYTSYEQGSRLDVKRVAALVAVAFAVTLAAVVGTRLSSDAIAVLVGVVAGVAASIPTALLLIVVTRRREEEDDEDTYYQERRRDNPPVIVVAPGGAPQALPQYMGSYPAQLAPPTGRRRFRVMGYDDDELEPLESEGESGRWYEE
jgi:hypothetical protein